MPHPAVLQLQAIGMHRFLPLRTLSRAPTASAPDVAGSLAPILTSSAVGAASCPMTEHGVAQSVMQRQPVALAIWQRQDSLAHRYLTQPSSDRYAARSPCVAALTRTEVARVHEKDTKRSKVESATLNLHDSCFIT